MNADLGSGWEVLVGVWWVREERAGFEGTVNNVSALLPLAI
jgi:hypothetical protein